MRATKSKRLQSILIALLVIAAATVVLVAFQQQNRTAVPVLRIVDGDTVHVRYKGRKESVRLLRIDTPERGQPGYEEATEALRLFVGGRKVRLEFEDPSQEVRDKYGRLLGYIFVDDVNVNVEIVRLGWSTFWMKFGRGRYAAEFERAEQEARSASVGMWAG